MQQLGSISNAQLQFGAERMQHLGSQSSGKDYCDLQSQSKDPKSGVGCAKRLCNCFTEELSVKEEQIRIV
jgi:hypothetical protein